MDELVLFVKEHPVACILIFCVASLVGGFFTSVGKLYAAVLFGDEE